MSVSVIIYTEIYTFKNIYILLENNVYINFALFYKSNIKIMW